MNMHNVLIADDHAMVRAGLRQFLVESGRVGEVAEAATGEQAMDLLRAKQFDLLILDISMPRRGGLDILKHVRSSFPATRVLIVSGFPERQYAVNVLKAGASGYLSKEYAPEELMKAVQIVLSGQRYVSGTLAQQLATDLDIDSDKPLHAELSEREFQVFCKLATGTTVSGIASDLSLSVKTVSTYCSRVFQKMSLKSNAELATYALRHGLIQ